MASKVRRVRCPGCWSVLEELPGVLLYRCGGCGNTLEAKNRKPESDQSELSSQETNNIVKSREADVLEDKEARISVHVSTGPSSFESSPDKDGTICQDGHSDSNGVICGECVPDALPSSLKGNCLNEGAPVEGQEPLKQDNLEGEGSEGCNRELYNDNGGCIGSGSSGIPSSGEFTDEVEVCVPEPIKHLEEQEKSYLQEDNKEDRVSQRTWQEGGECTDAVQDSPSDFVSHENENAPHLADQGIEDDDMAADSPLTTSSERIMNLASSDSMSSSQRSFNDSLASYLTCPEDEPSAGEGALHNFGEVSTLTGPTSELNVKQRSILSNLPTSGDYYGYGGSRPACDSIDEQISAQFPSRKGKGKDVDYIRTTEMSIKNKFKATNVNNKPEKDSHGSNSHLAIRNSHWDQEKYAETTGYASENILRQDKQWVGSSLSRYSGDPLVGRRIHSRSHNHHNLLPPHPHIRSSSQASYLEMEKLNLLRTLDVLKDQANRMQIPEVMTERRFPDRVLDGKFNSFNYDCLAAEHEIYPNLNRRGAYLLPDQAKGCPEQYNISRLGYSGEAARHGRHNSCSCSRGCPQDWRYSTQLPLCFHHSQNDHCMSSELSLYNTKSNLRIGEIRRSHMQEKCHQVKRYTRPVAGAAPFLACYHCSKLLQLPADFLIFKKRYHELMCNACRKVMKFSLEKGTHLVPYIPDASAPPPSEADYYSRNLEQRPSHSNCCQHVEAGWSFCRRCSRDLERLESVGSSTRILRYKKTTSEIKDLPPSSTHRLHHLMGYSSPSQVFD